MKILYAYDQLSTHPVIAQAQKAGKKTPYFSERNESELGGMTVHWCRHFQCHW